MGFYDAAAEAPGTLVLSKRYDAATLDQALRARRDHGTRILLDLCDNHFHYDGESARWDRRRRELEHAARSVDRVVASTESLAAIVREHAGNSVPVTVIGDAVDPPSLDAPSRWQMRHWIVEWQLKRLASWLQSGSDPECRLVWFGNAGSPNAAGGMSDLQRISGLLDGLSREFRLSLTVISNDHSLYRELSQSWHFRSSYLPWHASTISRALSLHDIAVIPVGVNPFTICKSNNRLATALVHGLGVVADRIPSYDEFREVAYLDQWPAGLRALMSGTGDRAARVLKGKGILEHHWSIASIADEWLKACGVGG